MNIRNYVFKVLVLFASLYSLTLKADIETSVQLEIPIANIGIEVGNLTDSNHYFSGSFHIGAGNLNRIELNWSKVVSQNESHLIGLGIGRLSALDNNSLSSFDVNESVTYGAINYRFYKNGIRQRGLHSYISLVFDDEGGIPFLGIGYNY